MKGSDLPVDGIAAGTEPAWHLDFAAADATSGDALAGFVRLELRPDDGRARYWTYLIAPGVDGIVVVRDHDVPFPKQRLEVRADGLWAELWCETPDEHWTFGLEAFGVRLDDADDALPVGLGDNGEIGERVAVGLDIEWETGAGTDTGTADAGLGPVHGDVLVGRARFALDGTGRFRHDATRTDWAAEVEACPGVAVSRVVVPMGAAHLERTLCRTEAGLEWRTTRVVGAPA